jgi:hypothetical protein
MGGWINGLWRFSALKWISGCEWRFGDFNESQNPLLQSMDLPVARKRPPPATKGHKILPTTANRKVPSGRPRGRPRKNPI